MDQTQMSDVGAGVHRQMPYSMSVRPEVTPGTDVRVLERPLSFLLTIGPCGSGPRQEQGTSSWDGLSHFPRGCPNPSPQGHAPPTSPPRGPVPPTHLALWRYPPCTRIWMCLGRSSRTRAYHPGYLRERRQELSGRFIAACHLAWSPVLQVQPRAGTACLGEGAPSGPAGTCWGAMGSACFPTHVAQTQRDTRPVQCGLILPEPHLTHLKSCIKYWMNLLNSRTKGYFQRTRIPSGGRNRS